MPAGNPHTCAPGAYFRAIRGVFELLFNDSHHVRTMYAPHLPRPARARPRMPRHYRPHRDEQSKLPLLTILRLHALRACSENRPLTQAAADDIALDTAQIQPHTTAVRTTTTNQLPSPVRRHRPRCHCVLSISILDQSTICGLYEGTWFVAASSPFGNYAPISAVHGSFSPNPEARGG